MVSRETGEAKKKKPPTFQHFPANRAKKLKKTWVVTKKIKSKWKAEKRRDGLATGSNLVQPVIQQQKDEDDVNDLSENFVGDESEGQNEAAVLSPTKIGRKSTSKETSEGPQANKERSLRDMTKEAYSPSSLHNYKSHALNRNRRHQESIRGRGSGGPVGKGRGQPNMKLRMGVMLEKIKRDFS